MENQHTTHDWLMTGHRTKIIEYFIDVIEFPSIKSKTFRAKFRNEGLVAAG